MNGRKLAPLTTAALAMTTSVGSAEAQQIRPDSYPIVELRQYTLHEGQRDVLIDLFEREFVESQEAVGMKVIGTFIDLDHPNRFVWLRGYSGMEQRKQGLTDFYGGPSWQAHRNKANATMIDSYNVRLLRAPDARAGFDLPLSRPAIGDSAPSGLVVATIYFVTDRPSAALKTFEQRVKPVLQSAGIDPIAWYVTEDAPNNFPRLPVREGERVLIWFAAFEDEKAHSVARPAVERAETLIASLFAKPAERLRLKPTARSLIRGLAPPGHERDFNFLHGRWNVTHRRLKARGTGSSEWVEFRGTAETRPQLGGLCNVEEHQMEGNMPSGVALRCFDRTAGRWSIYWISDRDGRLQPPVHGRLDGSEGWFFGEDEDAGRPVLARFHWQRSSNNEARWEQSFSYDQGQSWESNWVMEFRRAN